jgi:5-methylcytosine-specific restriction enzyme A
MQQRIRGRKLQTVRTRVLRRQPLCVSCLRRGRVAAALEVDHVTPLSKGGSDHETNMQGLCRACHEQKTASDMRYRPKRRIGADGWPAE